MVVIASSFHMEGGLGTGAQSGKDGCSIRSKALEATASMAMSNANCRIRLPMVSCLASLHDKSVSAQGCSALRNWRGTLDPSVEGRSLTVVLLSQGCPIRKPAMRLHLSCRIQNSQTVWLARLAFCPSKMMSTDNTMTVVTVMRVNFSIYSPGNQHVCSVRSRSAQHT